MSGLIRDFQSTDEGEWAIVNGDFAAVAGLDAVPQGIRIRLGMFLRECYLDESIGIDYVDSILIKNPDPLVVRGLLSDAIASTPDVTNVVGTELIFDGPTREANIAYVVDTVYSEDPLSGQVGVP